MRKAVTIDLDGTLIRCNSFTRYVWRMMWRHPAMMFHAAFRKLRFISHAEAKRRIMGVKVSDAELESFVDELLKYVRYELIDRRQADEAFVLATAAPAQYACRLAGKLGMEFCVASEQGAPENRGEVKLANVKQLLDREGLVLSCVITDHVDDYPLLLANKGGRNVLVNPASSMIDALDKAGIDFSCQF